MGGHFVAQSSPVMTTEKIPGTATYSFTNGILWIDVIIPGIGVMNVASEYQPRYAQSIHATDMACAYCHGVTVGFWQACSCNYSASRSVNHGGRVKKFGNIL